MINLKTSYYIDELNTFLINNTSQELVDSFFKNNSICLIENIPKFINFENVPPILKVAWNILNRGDNTRASLKLSRFILKNCFKEDYQDFDYSTPHLTGKIKIAIENKESLENLLNNFSKFNNQNAIELGSLNFRIYKALKQLIQFAQIQKVMLLLLMDNINSVNININDLTEDESELIISDLNELFTSLNNLSENKEIKLPIINYSTDLNAVNINLSSNHNNDEIVINSFVNNSNYSDLNLDVLTDRKIYYRKIGKVIDEEINENGINKQIQRFEYKTQKQERALKYFLQNLFRKTNFRA